MTTIDFIVVIAYFAFVLLLGPIYKSFSKNSSDYFRGGGTMLWWMVGSSAFVMSFSAWTFVGGAARAYETGTYFLLLYFANVVALIFAYFFVAARIRNMRIITPIDGIKRRYGPINEQFFTWLQLPFFLLIAGVGLYVISTFMAAVFHLPLMVLIPIIGVTVTFMAIMGGAWSVIASDFIQFLTVIVITVVLAVLAVQHPSVGGMSGLLEQMPREHIDWTSFARPSVLIFFSITLLINQLIFNNSMQAGAARYVFVKNGNDAKKAVLIQIVGFIILVPIWMIPAIAATILHPDLAQEYAHLNNPTEAAYVAVAITLLPSGLLGLLVCGIFAATMSTMDSGLNRSAGMIVRNFYLPIINSDASEEQQLRVGKAVTGIFGLIIISCGMAFSTLESMPIFNLFLLVGASVGLPAAIPLFLGMYIRRTPPWAAWTTTMLGLLIGLGLNIILEHENLQAIYAFFGATIPLTSNELPDVKLAIVMGTLAIICSAWYFITMLFARRSSADYQKTVDDFFIDMNTPIDERKIHAPSRESDDRQYKVMGSICMAYGGFIALMGLIPNSLSGHVSFFFCGGSIFGIGALLWWVRNQIIRSRQD
jgi:SSS family solute:Na+ symporter